MSNNNNASNNWHRHSSTWNELEPPHTQTVPLKIRMSIAEFISDWLRFNFRGGLFS